MLCSFGIRDKLSLFLLGLLLVCRFTLLGPGIFYGHFYCLIGGGLGPRIRALVITEIRERYANMEVAPSAVFFEKFFRLSL